MVVKRVEKVVWLDSKGVEHSTEAMAKQHEAFLELYKIFKELTEMFPTPEPDQVIHRMWENRSVVQEYLNWTEKMFEERR